MKKLLKNIIRRIPLSEGAKKSLRRLVKCRFFYFTSSTTHPISDYYGIDRGTPIDRFYIEQFIHEHESDIQGSCLELLNNDYTRLFGKDKVTKSDILDINKTNQDATIIDDLRRLQTISNDSYDCIILTQVLQFIDDVDSAISECHRILKKGGVLLVTLPSLSRIDCCSGTEGDFWRFTAASAQFLFQKKFDKNKTTIISKGNVRAGIYFYSGLAQQDISEKVLKKDDVNFPLIITVKTIK